MEAMAGDAVWIFCFVSYMRTGMEEHIHTYIRCMQVYVRYRGGLQRCTTILPKATAAEIARMTGFPSGGWVVDVGVHGRFAPHKVGFAWTSIGSADHQGRVTHGRLECCMLVIFVDGI